jgi:hypothetical protein
VAEIGIGIGITGSACRDRPDFFYIAVLRLRRQGDALEMTPQAGKTFTPDTLDRLIGITYNQA